MIGLLTSLAGVNGRKTAITSAFRFLATALPACFLFLDSSAASNFSLESKTLPIRQMRLGDALSEGEFYPQIDWDRLDFSNPAIISSNHFAYSLRNSQMEVLLLPNLGRIYSLAHQANQHNQLWTNPVVRPIKAHNDTGWWMVWGGIEFTIPRGEHGTTWALPWKYEIAEDSARRKAVRMSVREPATGLMQEVIASVYPDSALCEVQHVIENRSSTNVLFALWANAMIAPGGRNELTARTELIVPCTAMMVPERDFTRWMLGERRQPFKNNPLRFMENWRAPGDLLAESLTADFYGAFSHEAREGLVRLADRTVAPGMDIWAWGFPPPEERQREFTLATNLGYVELWGGTSKDFTDEGRRLLKPGEKFAFTEYYIPFHGTEGVTYADTNVVLSFYWSPEEASASLSLFPVRPLNGRVSVMQGETETGRAALGGTSPVIKRFSISPTQQQVPELFLQTSHSELIRIKAQQRPEVQWGKPYLEPPETR